VILPFPVFGKQQKASCFFCFSLPCFVCEVEYPKELRMAIIKSKTEALAAYTRLKGQVQKARGEAEAVAGRAMIIGGSAAGGAATAILEKKLPNVPGTEINTSVAAAGVIGAGAIAGLFGRYNDPMAALAGGIIACKTRELVSEQVK
jgi:hypothetical protein